MSTNVHPKAQPPSSDKRSIDYYDRNVEKFFSDTSAIDMAVHWSRFLSVVPAGGRILDAGCGSGRDSKHFLEQGYEVVAFDGSAEMARKASEFLGREVIHLLFEDMQFQEEFDGIWACASLLHVPKAMLPEILKKLANALKPGGFLYVSFKKGEAERRKDDGRFFTDMDEATLRRLLEEVPELRLEEAWLTKDVRPSRAHELWLNCLVRKRKDHHHRGTARIGNGL
jgi:SAM-dependent methyltransferase